MNMSHQVSSLTIRLWSKLLHEAGPDWKVDLSSERESADDGLGSRLAPVCEVQGLGLDAFQIQGS